MLDQLFALETFGIKLGLDNITRLCAALNHPERSFATISIAGTIGEAIGYGATSAISSSTEEWHRLPV